MKEIKTNILVLSLIGLVAFGVGLPIGIFAFNPSVEEGPAINITSLEDGEIVHSIVVVDAATITLDAIEVIINDVIVANYVPYEWNNMLEPVGTYNVTIKGYLGPATFQSTKIIVIPETFVVPIDYEFTEDFVVHTGQTVTFADGNWEIQSDTYYNGMTPINERTPLYLNVFGDLIIDNASVIARMVACENNGSITMIRNSFMNTYETGDARFYNHTTGYYGAITNAKFIRFDDNATLYYDDSYTIKDNTDFYDDSYIIFNELGSLLFVFNENSISEVI